jgi:hypothetical protein
MSHQKNHLLAANKHTKLRHTNPSLQTLDLDDSSPNIHHLETNNPKRKKKTNERQMLHSSPQNYQIQKETTSRIKHTRKKKKGYHK